MLPRPQSCPYIRHRKTVYSLLALLLLILFQLPALSAENQYPPSFHRIVLLGDPHLPGKHLDMKDQLRKTINSWNDVDLVVALGDICQDRGTADELATAARFFSGLNKPFLPIPGNHDVGYEDETSMKGKRVRVSDDKLRATKLERFRSTFGLSASYQSRQMGGYLLLFLATDSSGHLAEMSEAQLAWLDEELNKNRSLPAIVFFHAPLAGTLAPYNSKVNEFDYIAQPADRIAELTARHTNLLLWVSGHTHTSPKEPSFASPLNLYQGRITNIHATDLNRSRIWTRSLFLYPDRVAIKTWDHASNNFVPELEQTVRVVR